MMCYYLILQPATNNILLWVSLDAALASNVKLMSATRQLKNENEINGF